MKFRVLIIFLLGVFLAIGFITYKVVTNDGEQVNIKQSSKQITDDIVKIKEQSEVYEWVKGRTIKDGYLEQEDKEILKKNKDPKYIVQYLFGSIELKDPNIFIQAFDANVISRDLFSFKNPDKNQVALDLMNRISRGGKISRVGIMDVKGNVGGQITVNIKVEYTDSKKVKIPLRLVLYGTDHYENDDVYYIQTSVLDIIKKIENS